MIRLARPTVGIRELLLVAKVIRSGNLVEGKMVAEFERFVCDYLGVGYGVACTSATIGLEMALRALDIGPGDEVIVPGFTHPATALSVMSVGAKPVTVDVDYYTYNTTAELIKPYISKRTKAIIPVSLFGNPLDIEPIMKLGLPVIEDAACSLGSERLGKKVGSQATMTVFSFHPRKVFATGDGGLIVTNQKRLADKLKSIKHFGGFREWGTNYRMSDILGAVALGQVRQIEKILRVRRQKAAYYDSLLVCPPQNSNYQSYVIPVEHRDKRLRYMREKGIECQVGTYALHRLEVFQDYPIHPVCDILHDSLIALPLHHKLTRRQQRLIIKTLYEQ